MPVISEGHLKDCEWVVERCKLHLDNNDRNGAKAWIITARSLFPDNFAVQYEAFSLHLCCEELKEAAKALADLFTKFPRESKLKSYVSELVAAVIAAGQDSAKTNEAQPPVELFNLLPAHTQKSILLQASGETSDTLEKCRIWVVALKRFPDTAPTLGLDLYDALNQKPSSTDSALVSDNPCKELLVTEVIPLLSESREISVEHPLTRSNHQTVVLKTSHLCQWLELSASYFAVVTAQSLLHNKSCPCAGKVGWERLHHLFMMIAEKCTWREVLHNKQIGPHLPAKLRWLGLEKLSGYTAHAQPFEAPRNMAIACFYIAVFLFFDVAWEYCIEMLYPSAGGERTGKPLWILIEERSKPQGDEKATKRRKLDEHQALMNLQTGSRVVDTKIVESFMVAIDCWDFLQSNVTYRGEFSRLCQQWGAFDWVWLNFFRADMAIYKGDHSTALQILQHEWHRIKDGERSKPQSLRIILQMVNCAALLGDAKASCGFASEVISFIPDPPRDRLTTPTQSQAPNPKPNAARQLRLLRCSMMELLPFCIEVIIRTLKDIAFSDPKNDCALGQLLVLLQYNWPKEEEMFASVITTIQKRRKFTFPEFFNYIITIDILEEIMYLANCESLQVTLLPQDTAAKSRTVTRGVNRGAREELMSAMERQIQRCGDPIEPLLRDFFRQEKLSLPPDT